MQTFVISIMTRDRVGIIADVTAVIQNLQGNLGELSQTVVGGYFTMIFFVSFPATVVAADIRGALQAIDPDDLLDIGIRAAAMPAPADQRDQANLYILTAVGDDRLGLVASLSRYLRQRQVNIIDQSTLVSQGRYTMILLLHLPPGTDVVRLKRSLQAAAKEIGISVELQHHEIFRATNEV